MTARILASRTLGILSTLAAVALVIAIIFGVVSP